MISRIFPISISANFIIFVSVSVQNIWNLSNRSKHKCDHSISQIFSCNFCRVFVIWNLCEAGARSQWIFKSRTLCYDLTKKFSPHCSHCGKAWVCFGMLMRHPVTLAHVKAQSYLMYSRNLSNSILNFTENVYCTTSHEIHYK